MEVVLRQDVDHVGLRGEIVNVARGYARNYLLPRGMAELATPGLKRELERRETLKARNEAKDTGEAQAIAKKLEATELRFEVNAGPTGSLFGSVTATNVVDRLWEEQKIRLDRRKLGLQSIKRVGRYTVPVEVFTDVTAELRILVVPEGGELPVEAPEATQAPAAAEAPRTESPETAVPAPAAEEPAGEERAAEEIAEPTAVDAPEAEVPPVTAAADPPTAEATDDVPLDDAIPDDPTETANASSGAGERSDPVAEAQDGA